MWLSEFRYFTGCMPTEPPHAFAIAHAMALPSEKSSKGTSSRPFLLIVRTGRIVTARAYPDE